MAEEQVNVSVEAGKEAGPFANLQEVLSIATKAGGVKCGLHEALRAVAKADKTESGEIVAGGARVAILADDCDEDAYKKVVTALCAEKNVPLVSVPKAEDLGKWCGLCKIDKNGEPRKIVSTSCAVVVDYGVPSAALKKFTESLKA